MIDDGRKLNYFPGFMKFWKPIIAMAAACFAGGLEETTAQVVTIRDPKTGGFVNVEKTEPLEIHYTDSSGTTYTLQVEKNVEVLEFVDLTSLTLPKGLTKLHTLEIDSQPDGIDISIDKPEPPKRYRKRCGLAVSISAGKPW